MSYVTKAKKGGAKLSRSETVTVRLDPKLRYLAELASRKQRRTLSSFIEWAIEESLKNIIIYQGSGFNNDYGRSIFDEATTLWDIDEPDRFLKLANNYPELLTHEEQVIWKLIHEYSVYNPNIKRSSKFYNKKDKNLDISLVRACWIELQNVANGTTTEEGLKAAICMHDDIPF